MSVIRWEDPPPNGARNGTRAPRRGDHWRRVAAELRANPGRWGLVLEGESYNYAGGMAGQIKRAALVAFRPAGSFDAQTRTIGGCRVYARYVGEADA